MSHHHLTMLPGLVPLGRPTKPDKKRRLRRARASETAYVQDSDGISAIDGEIFVLDDDDEGAEAEMDAAEREGRSPSIGQFSQAAMKTLLEAQEETKAIV